MASLTLTKRPLNSARRFAAAGDFCCPTFGESALGLGQILHARRWQRRLRQRAQMLVGHRLCLLCLHACLGAPVVARKARASSASSTPSAAPAPARSSAPPTPASAPARPRASGTAAAPARPCAAPADCPASQYCDDTRSCYDCDYLRHSKVDCDALGGDCCSAAFLRSCPSDPKKAACAAAQSPCDAALQSACGSKRGAAFDCIMCAGSKQQQLRAAGCANDQIHAWCEFSAENFPGSRLLTPEWGAALNGWAGKDECQEWALCCSTFDDCESAGEFHAGCDGRAPTLTVARNAGNFTFGGFVRSPPLVGCDLSTSLCALAIFAPRFSPAFLPRLLSAVGNGLGLVGTASARR